MWSILVQVDRPMRAEPVLYAIYIIYIYRYTVKKTHANFRVVVGNVVLGDDNSDLKCGK